MVQKLKTPPPGKFIVGLTGVFGSGKSTVAHLFEELGTALVNADVLAHEALMEGSPVFREIEKLFEKYPVKKGASLDRKKIAGIVFKDARIRKKLEGIVHPYVLDRMIEEIHQAEQKIVVCEVPLLFEAGFDRICDKTITVKASQVRIRERLEELGIGADEVRAREKAQMRLSEKTKRSDIVIDNSGTLDQTRTKVKKVWQTLKPALKGAA